MNSAHNQTAVRAGYESLSAVLDDALNQMQAGKGHERHAEGQPFEAQPMQKLIALYGQGFALGQAAKKAQESQRLPYERARAELLGAINYLAGAVLALDMQNTTSVTIGESAMVRFPFTAKFRPADAPDWATAEGHYKDAPLWLCATHYASKHAPDAMRMIDDIFSLRASEITLTAEFPANDNSPIKNEPATK